MKKLLLSLASLAILWSCASSKTDQAPIPVAHSALNDSYYERLPNNIARLQHLMQGTFVAHSAADSTGPKSWNVTEGDSVVLYSVAIGDVSKYGYWLYSYEFMTSLPNNPIYTSIKQIKQIERDSFVILYYNAPKHYKLIDILKNPQLLQDIDLKNLKETDKKTVYVRLSPTHFLGASQIYEDKDCACLRQNTYDISPSAYNVETSFFSKSNGSRIDKKNRPNLMLRREMDKSLLLKIAQKEYELEAE